MTLNESSGNSSRSSSAKSSRKNSTTSTTSPPTSGGRLTKFFSKSKLSKTSGVSTPVTATETNPTRQKNRAQTPSNGKSKFSTNFNFTRRKTNSNGGSGSTASDIGESGLVKKMRSFVLRKDPTTTSGGHKSRSRRSSAAVSQQYQQPVMAFERFGGSETHLNNGGGGGYGGYGVREAPSVASLSSSATGSSRGSKKSSVSSTSSKSRKMFGKKARNSVNPTGNVGKGGNSKNGKSGGDEDNASKGLISGVAYASSYVRKTSYSVDGRDPVFLLDVRCQNNRQVTQRQRQEIYALNRVMTRLENERFKKFCQEKGFKGDQLEAEDIFM